MNAITFDIEEHFQVTGFADRIPVRAWDQYESRVEIGTRVILDTLAAAGARATMFVLGWVAERRPDLVRLMRDAGHEIASHGHWHQRVDTQTPAAFRADVRRAKAALEDITGDAVTAYRAPSFSITPACAWAYEVLAEEGYTLDSSQSAGRGANSTAPASAAPYPLPTPAGDLLEVPLPTLRVLGRDMPVGGGGYFRLFPYAFTRRALASLGRPFVAYLHPWEFDPAQPRLPGSVSRRFRHRVGLRQTEGRLRRLLADFPCGSLSEMLAASRMAAA